MSWFDDWAQVKENWCYKQIYSCDFYLLFIGRWVHLVESMLINFLMVSIVKADLERIIDLEMIYILITEKKIFFHFLFLGCFCFAKIPLFFYLVLEPF